MGSECELVSTCVLISPIITAHLSHTWIPPCLTPPGPITDSGGFHHWHPYLNQHETYGQNCMGCPYRPHMGMLSVIITSNWRKNPPAAPNWHKLSSTQLTLYLYPKLHTLYEPRYLAVLLSLHPFIFPCSVCLPDCFPCIQYVRKEKEGKKRSTHGRIMGNCSSHRFCLLLDWTPVLETLPNVKLLSSVCERRAHDRSKPRLSRTARRRVQTCV